MEQAVAAHYERVSASPSFKAVAQFWHLLVNVVEDIAYAVVMLAIVIWLRVTLFYRTVFADINVDGSALRFDATVHRVDVGMPAGEDWVLGSEARFSDVNNTPTTTSTPSASRLSSGIPSKAASPVPSGKGVKPIPTQSPKPASDKPIAALIVRIRDNEVLEKLRAVQNSLVDMDGRFFDHLEAENSFLIPLLRLRIDRDSVPLIEEAIRTCVSALTKPLTAAIRGVYHDADDGHLYGGIPQGRNEVLCPLRKFVVALTTSLASKRFQVLPEPLGKDWHRVMLARLESAEQRRVLGKYLTKISDQDKALGRVRVEDIEIVSSNSDGWRKEYGHAIKKVYLKSKAAFSSPNDFSTSTAVSQPDDNLDGVGLSTSALALKATNNGGFIPIIAVRVRSQEIAKAVEVFRSMALDQDQRLSPYLSVVSSLHITLAKISVNEENVSAAKDAMQSAVSAFNRSIHSTSPLTLTIKRLGSFGSKTLYADVGEGAEELRRLVGILKESLKEHNVAVKLIPSVLHMTLVQIYSEVDLSLGQRHFAKLKSCLTDDLFGVEDIKSIELCTSGEWHGDHTLDHYKVLHTAELSCASFPYIASPDS